MINGDATCFTIGLETYAVETAGADEYFVTAGDEYAKLLVAMYADDRAGFVAYVATAGDVTYFVTAGATAAAFEMPNDEYPTGLNCFTIGDETYEVEEAGAEEYFVTNGVEYAKLFERYADDTDGFEAYVATAGDEMYFVMPGETEATPKFDAYVEYAGDAVAYLATLTGTACDS